MLCSAGQPCESKHDIYKTTEKMKLEEYSIFNIRELSSQNQPVRINATLAQSFKQNQT
jgi:hypothetical protein